MERIEFDTTELYNRIIKQYGSVEAFAAVIGMNPRTLAKRLDGSTEFYAKEIEAICEAMNLGVEELNLYFFTKKEKQKEPLSVVHGLTEEQYKLTLEIAELISGRPDRREIMRKWTGNINDLVAALAQI